MSFPSRWHLPTTDAYAKLRAASIHAEYFAPALNPELFGAEEVPSDPAFGRVLYMPFVCDDRDEAMILAEQSVAQLHGDGIAVHAAETETTLDGTESSDGRESEVLEPLHCCVYPLAMNETHAMTRDGHCNETASAIVRAQHANARRVVVASQQLVAEVAEYEATIRQPDSTLDRSPVAFVGISFHLFQSHSAIAVRELFDQTSVRIRHAVLRDFVSAGSDLNRPQNMSINQLWLQSMLALGADVLVTDEREQFDLTHGFAYRAVHQLDRAVVALLDEYDVVISQVLDHWPHSQRRRGQLRLLWPIEHEYLEHNNAYDAALPQVTNTMRYNT